jgi:hypothetical protein
VGLISVVAWAVSSKSQGRKPGALRKGRSVRTSADDDDDRSVDLAPGLSLVEGHAIAPRRGSATNLKSRMHLPYAPH